MKRNLGWALPVAALVGVLPMAGATRASHEPEQALPQGVTAAMIEEGKGIFHGAGLCSSCHAEGGVGTPVGPNLADKTWLHSDGAYPAILNTIKTGVQTPKESQIPMLAKGGSGITDAQAAAVAAYVWKLSH